MPLTSVGFTPKPINEIVDDINLIFIDVFGTDFDTEPSSPNGLFVQQLANKAFENEEFYALIYGDLYNPDVTGSIWLDAIAALNGIYRKPATRSSVQCVVVGSVGTFIPSGFEIQSTNGDLFYNPDPITIDSTGSETATFLSIEFGTIPVNANTVNIIVDRVSGWNSVNNPAQGSIGTLRETDYQFRQSRANQLGLQGSGSIASLQGALWQVANVTDAKSLENDSGANITLEGVSMTPYSIYCAVVGGTDNDIGKTILDKKPMGTPMLGNITGVYFNPDAQANYTYRFQRPDPTDVKLVITAKADNSYPTNIEQLVKASMVANFNGLSGIQDLDRVKIGETINTSRFVPSLLLLGVWNLVGNPTIGLASAPPIDFSFEIKLPATEIAVLTEANVEFIIQA